MAALSHYFYMYGFRMGTEMLERLHRQFEKKIKKTEIQLEDIILFHQLNQNFKTQQFML